MAIGLVNIGIGGKGILRLSGCAGRKIVIVEKLSRGG
jgi:hypothetical protein